MFILAKIRQFVKLRSKLIKISLVIFGLVVLGWGSMNIWWLFGQSSEKIVFLDIGQGDATFIQFSNGQQMLVDCGKDSSVISALGRVMSFSDHEIDYLVVTHPDLDHYGGCEEVLRRFSVGVVVTNGMDKNDDKTWLSFKSSIEHEKKYEQAEHYIIDRVQEWVVGDSKLLWLYPDHSIKDDFKIPGFVKDTGVNNTSIVMMVGDLLLTGDAEKELEEYLILSYGNKLKADVLKVGHHGSQSSSGEEFLNLVNPSQAVISVGEDNSFGHPSLRVLRRLERLNVEVLRTDLQGDVFYDIISNR